jgi:hypothetical protein
VKEIELPGENSVLMLKCGFFVLGTESDCTIGYVKCGNQVDCIYARLICDGTQQCPDGSDESLTNFIT